ncbi:hypothetical protein JCM10908_003501 [Rhodotorula pacifica]|uniref:uncharacterized protein n=1 Tax=Rhodotorula pacifica TaxID=1495444 RepID=UPI00316B9532
MNSLEPVLHGSPSADPSSLDSGWFLSSTPTSPPTARAPATPLTKPSARHLGAAPLLLEPVIPDQPQDREADHTRLATLNPHRVHSSLDADPIAREEDGEAPCMSSLSIRAPGRRDGSAWPASSQTSFETGSLLPSPSHEGLVMARDEDCMRDVTPPPFAFDPFEGEPRRAQVDVPSASHDLSIDPPTPPLGPFSTTVSIQRSFRSRYASSSTDSLPLGPDEVETTFTRDEGALLTRTPSLAHKRSHSHVAPSTGDTPPASYADSEEVGMYSPPSMPLDFGFSAVEPRIEQDEEEVTRPSARWRRSFSYEAQRAEPTTSTLTASAMIAPQATSTSSSTQHASYVGMLRRRPRQPSASDSNSELGSCASNSQMERGNSKRRRAGSLLTSATGANNVTGTTSPVHASPWTPGSASHPTVSPILARSEAATAAQTTTDDDVRTIRRRTRLSFGCLRTGPGQLEDPTSRNDGATSAPLAAPAGTAAQNRLLGAMRSHPAPPLASRDALARQSSLFEAQAQRSNALSLRGEDLLREAAGVLRRAEDSVSRASNLVQSQAWETRLLSVDALPEPGASDVRRPVVGVRFGRGWSSDSTQSASRPTRQPEPVSPTSPPARRRRSSLFGLSAPSASLSSSSILPTSPPPSASRELDDPESSSTGSTSAASTRARQWQFLSSLRARRPRLPRDATAVSPPEREDQVDVPAPTSGGSSSYLRSWTLPSPPLASGLAVSSFDEEAEVLVAEQLNEHLLERRRVSNDLEAGLSPPAPSSHTDLWGEPRSSGISHDSLASRRMRGPTERANERWRRGEPPLPSTDGAPASQQRRFPSWRNQPLATPHTRHPNMTLDSPPLRLGATPTTAEGDAYMRRRDESPSPRSRRHFGRSSSSLFSTQSLNTAEEGIPVSASHRLDEGDRASIRLPLPHQAGAPASRANSRVRFEDAEEAPPLARGWSAPSTGPLMLSSGSDGRRMIFPHPANAAGPSVAPVGASAYGMNGDDLEARRFFEEDDLHPPPFTFDRLARRLPDDRIPAPRVPPLRYPWEAGYVAADAAGFEAQPAAASTDTSNRGGFNTRDEAAPNANTPRRLARYGLADLFAHAEAQLQSTPASADAEMRQRRPIIPARPEANDSVPQAARAEGAYEEDANALLEDRLAQHRQHRVQRLQALRQERNLMRSLLSGTPSDEGQSSDAVGSRDSHNSASRVADSDAYRSHANGPAADPPRSPGAIWRRRGLGEFLRGFGAGGGRGLISMFDEDFPSFWGRDSAALDPRNYLDDDEFDSSYEALIRLSERLGDAKPKGVSADKLASLAKFKYSVWPMPQRSQTAPSTSLSSAPMASTSSLAMEQDPPSFARKGLEKEERCGICLCDYAEDDDCMLGHCGHGFHEECLTSWLKEKGTCPSLFGVGEIVGVLTNPTEVLRNLTESKKMLEDARRELKESQERAQIPRSHTFSPLPGFFDRPAEIQVLERSLGSVPGFTVLFGASSVGKTALLRQVLSSDHYHVVHFDLRIAGFADLASLYFSLSTQLEAYFASIPDKLGRDWGWGEFEKESFAFKHDRLDVQKRIENGGEVKTSDIAHLLELFQSALLSYWNFQPMTAAERKAKEDAKKDDKEKGTSTEAKTKAATGAKPSGTSADAKDTSKGRLKGGAVPQPEQEDRNLFEARSLRGIEAKEDAKGKSGAAADKDGAAKEGEEEEEEAKPPPKKMPVFFLDEAHKLPALIQSTEAMKTFLDSQLVLTKQDRLCHIVHATSDPFHLHWLRQLNVMQHCNILSVGDCSKDEARRYFQELLLPHIPDKLKRKISFDDVYKVFGGKLAHLSDYVGEFVNSDGDTSPRQSTHFLQAHALLNLHLIHSSPSKPGDEESPSQGFAIYSSLRAASPHASPSPFGESDAAEFQAADFLKVMQHLQPGAEDSILYFPLCRKLGARAVDGMIRGRLLELRWTEAITEEGETSRETRSARREAVGPRVLPTTPVVRYAMGEVLEEYRREGYTLPDASDLIR